MVATYPEGENGGHFREYIITQRGDWITREIRVVCLLKPQHKTARKYCHWSDSAAITTVIEM